MNKNINFSHDSIVDDFGRVFFYNEKVFRLINDDAKDFCLELINSDFFKELIAKNYIPKTEVSNFDIDFNCMLVLEHERCLETKPDEWSFQMYKDAAELILDIKEICDHYGYELKDAHPHNILFKENKPIFIDIGSFQKKKGINWVAEEAFLKTFYIPLILWQKGEYYFLRLILENDFYQRIIPQQDILSISYISKYISPIKYFKIKKSIFHFNTKNLLIIFIFRFINQVIRLTTNKKYCNFFKISQSFLEINKSRLNKIAKNDSSTIWHNYHNEFFVDKKNKLDNRFEKIVSLIIEHCSASETIIDLAGNQGYFSSILENNNIFSRIIMADYDSNAIDEAYIRMSNSNSKINPVLLNFMVPNNLISTTNRFKSDIAIALAVTHHLILTQGFSISAIFERLSMYSKKYVIVEFMPLGLWDGIEEKSPQTPQWYTLDWFKINFIQYFKILHLEKIEKNRIILIGEKNLC